jgi:hypothetical protein
MAAVDASRRDAASQDVGCARAMQVAVRMKISTSVESPKQKNGGNYGGG